jgi:cytoskeletal protein CcmA (bactofilin family)
MFASLKKQPFIKMAQLSTLIADGVEIVGDLVFTHGMRIDGRIKGDVTGRSGDAKSPSLLVLSAQGHIEGSIRCGDAVINGTVVGDLDVEHRLELQSDARVTGTIRYRQLQMDVGATVQGHLLRVAATAATAAPGNVVELGAEKSAVAERR